MLFSREVVTTVTTAAHPYGVLVVARTLASRIWAFCGFVGLLVVIVIWCCLDEGTPRFYASTRARCALAGRQTYITLSLCGRF